MISSYSGPSNLPGKHVQVFIDGEEVTDFITNIYFQVENSTAPAVIGGEITHLDVRVSYRPAALNRPWAFEEKT